MPQEQQVAKRFSIWRQQWLYILGIAVLSALRRWLVRQAAHRSPCAPEERKPTGKERNQRKHQPSQKSSRGPPDNSELTRAPRRPQHYDHTDAKSEPIPDASRREIGSEWHFDGERRWQWLHDGKKPNGWLKFGANSVLSINLCPNGRGSWELKTDGKMLLTFGRYQHTVSLEEAVEGQPPSFKLQQRIIPNSQPVKTAPKLARSRGRLDVINPQILETAGSAVQPTDSSRLRKNTDRKMIDNAVEFILRYKMELLDNADREAWSHCRAACKTFHKYAMESKTGVLLAKIMRIRLVSMWKLDEVARYVGSIISLEKWSEENPRCCSQYCCNNFNAETGVWAPMCDFMQDSDVWWRNKAAIRNSYLKCAPQKKLSAIMAEWSKRNDTAWANVRAFYVACSELCFSDAKYALEIIHWRDHTEFYLFLGVDKSLAEEEPSTTA